MERHGPTIKSRLRSLAFAGILATSAYLGLDPDIAFAQSSSEQKPATPNTPIIDLAVPGSIQTGREVKELTQGAPVRPGTVFRPGTEAKYVPPPSLDEIVKRASKGMGISEAHARRIIMCESGGDPSKVNPDGGASGIWQIMDNELNRSLFEERGWNYRDDVLNIEKNNEVAIMLWGIQGAGGWSCK